MCKEEIDNNVHHLDNEEGQRKEKRSDHKMGERERERERDRDRDRDRDTEGLRDREQNR